jgi:peptidoglycan hydrolase-like protein with peptidoglycan-binding domain
MIATTTVAKAIAAGVAAATGLELWMHFHPQLQSLRHVGPTGAPIQVVVPVVATATKPGVAAAPIPPGNGSAATFTPPPAVPAGALALEPTVITPSGAANLSIDSVSDVQNALTTLGIAKLTADGKTGPQTASAVTLFQAAHGLPSTGIIDPPLKSALQAALASLAGTQKHIGQSIPVQAAAVGASTPDSPLGASIVSAGLHKIVSLFQGLFHSDVGAEGADLPKTDEHKAALIKLQRVLNLLGASPPLDEGGTMTPETTAAIKAFQVTYGLVADGVPLQKTVAAMALAVDPAAQAAILPSVPKAADHVAGLAATEDPASVIKDKLTAASGALQVAAAAPAPSDTQLHASTAAANAATAATASPEVPVAAPLAAAAHALATAAATPTPDPAAIAAAATHVANASAACTGSSCPSLQAASEHLSAAATAPNAADAGDHLAAAATHLSNAAGGAPAAGATAGFGWGGGWGGGRGWGGGGGGGGGGYQGGYQGGGYQGGGWGGRPPPPMMPGAAPGQGPNMAAYYQNRAQGFQQAFDATQDPNAAASLASGEFDGAGGSNLHGGTAGFGWDFGPWAKRISSFWPWRRRLHPAYAPPVPGQLAPQVALANATIPAAPLAPPPPAMPAPVQDANPAPVYAPQYTPQYAAPPPQAQPAWWDPSRYFRHEEHAAEQQAVRAEDAHILAHDARLGIAPTNLVPLPGGGYPHPFYPHGESDMLGSRPAIGFGFDVQSYVGSQRPPFGAESKLPSQRPAFGIGSYVPSDRPAFGMWERLMQRGMPINSAVQGAPPPPPGHGGAQDYWRARNASLGQNGWDDRYDRHHYNRFGARNPWAGQAPPAPPIPTQQGPFMPQAIDPNAVNQYQDPNAGMNPAVDSAMASGDVGRELGELS